MKLAYITLLIVAMVLCSSLLQTTMAGPTFCRSKCAKRCSNAGYLKRCLIYCRICCNKCGCVPSGTYGNKSECACYRDMLNSKGKSKCP